jgi:acetyltransferase-like isoleucine patch superfamily enzyme
LRPALLGVTATQQAKLTAGDGTQQSYMGTGVALSGNTALVGTYYADVPGSPNQGAGYVYVRTGTTWAEQAKLTASDGARDNFLGYSVAIDGDTAVLGAFGADISGKANQGAAYVFTRSGTTWTQQAKLTAGDGAAADQFGFSVALSGNTVVVGANQATIGGNTKQGAAYVFTRSGTTWSQQAKLTAIGGVADDNFGVSAALTGNTALIGAPVAEVSGVRIGAGYVFTRSGTTWTQQARLTADDGAASDLLGFSAALDNTGTTALLGAYNADVGSNANQGAGYVFTRTGTTWAQQAKLTAGDGAAEDQAGYSVALSGNTAILGAYGADVSGKADQGAAYLFTRSGTTWAQGPKITGDDAQAGDRVGASAALDGTASTAALGVPFADIGTSPDPGAAYVFGLTYTDAPPPAPVGLAPTGFAPGTLTPTYRWTDVGADLYAIALYNLNTGAQVYTPPVAFLPNCTAGECTGTPTVTLQNGGIYGFYVAGYNAAGWGAWSAGKAFLVSAPPAAPQALQPSGVYIPNPPTLEATYTFTAVEGGVQYAVVLYDLTTNAQVYFKVLDTVANPTACSGGVCRFKPTGADVTLLNGRLYGWFVAAVSYAGPGPFSAGRAFNLYVAPGVPNALTPAGSTANPITFRWDGVTGATEYYLLVLNSAGAQVVGQWVNGATACAASPCQYALGSNLAAGQYFWYVLAANPAGTSAYSAARAFSVASAPPAAPTFRP